VAGKIEIEMVGGPKDGERTLAPSNMRKMHYVTEHSLRTLFHSDGPFDPKRSRYHRYERDAKQPRLFRYAGIVDDPAS
jgi:hypothetical protein